MIDYKLLLLKYIDHIGIMESVYYMNDRDFDYSIHEMINPFTEIEIKELINLLSELENNYKELSE